jgi:hypothetical protein
MPLLDYLSSGDDDRQSEVAAFLSDHWQDVLDEEPVQKLRHEMESPEWTGDGLDVKEVQVGDVIKATITFKAKGLDDHSRNTGETIRGSSVVVIDEFDNVEFTQVRAESESG